MLPDRVSNPGLTSQVPYRLRVVNEKHMLSLHIRTISISQGSNEGSQSMFTSKNMPVQVKFLAISLSGVKEKQKTDVNESVCN